MASRGTGGRPGGKSQCLYTPEALDQRCNTYFEDCRENNRKPTRPGLCLWLDISMDTLNRYEEGKGTYEGHARAIKKAMLRMMDALEQRDDTKSIFLLKQPCYGGYADRPVDEGAGRIQIAVTFGQGTAGEVAGGAEYGK